MTDAFCPLCGHEWRRHDPEDGCCDAHSNERLGVCECGRDMAWMHHKIAALSRAALAGVGEARPAEPPPPDQVGAPATERPDARADPRLRSRAQIKAEIRREHPEWYCETCDGTLVWTTPKKLLLACPNRACAEYGKERIPADATAAREEKP